MSEPFLGEIKIVSFPFAPKRWAFCNGQTMPISQNQALFSLLGTRFGGDGRTTFALPNLQARVPIHAGSYILGQAGGEAAHTLIMAEMPGHAHAMSASNSAGNTNIEFNNVLATSPSQLYDAGNQTTLNPSSVAVAGASQAHENRQPYLVLTFCIALVGIYPSRN